MCIFVQNICQHEYGHNLSESQRDTLFQSHEAAEDPNANIWENWYMRCIATCIGKVGMAGLSIGLGVMMMRDFVTQQIAGETNLLGRQSFQLLKKFQISRAICTACYGERLSTHTTSSLINAMTFNRNCVSQIGIFDLIVIFREYF